LLDLVGLEYAADRRVDALSKGMQQRLGLAQALIGEPQIIILDEPTSALDPEGRRLVRGVIDLQRQRGALVLLSSHLLAEVEQACDTVAVVSAGKLVARGTVAELLQAGHERVRITTDQGTEVVEMLHAQVPKLVESYVHEGRRILSIEPIVETLEDAYLRVIAASEAEASQ
jgi:ABC-2 type transport system ATP-binding protein